MTAPQEHIANLRFSTEDVEAMVKDLQTATHVARHNDTTVGLNIYDPFSTVFEYDFEKTRRVALAERGSSMEGTILHRLLENDATQNDPKSFELYKKGLFFDDHSRNINDLIPRPYATLRISAEDAHTLLVALNEALESAKEEGSTVELNVEDPFPVPTTISFNLGQERHAFFLQHNTYINGVGTFDDKPN